jgi:hypothetical protein
MKGVRIKKDFLSGATQCDYAIHVTALIPRQAS